MKSTYAIKALLALAFGLLFALYVNADYARWNRLGRETFLAYEQHRFDIYIARPYSGIGFFIIAPIFALGLCVFYEAIAFVGGKMISKLSAKTSIENVPQGDA